MQGRCAGCGADRVHYCLTLQLLGARQVVPSRAYYCRACRAALLAMLDLAAADLRAGRDTA